MNMPVLMTDQIMFMALSLFLFLYDLKIVNGDID